jgi:Phage-related protein
MRAAGPGSGEPILKVVFYRSQSGNEPVREWLLGLSRANRKAIGQDVKTAQYGWPLGMPLIRKLQPRLWEVRSHVTGGIARVIFTVDGGVMVLLHGFIKKSRKMPTADLATVERRLARLEEE